MGRGDEGRDHHQRRRQPDRLAAPVASERGRRQRGERHGEDGHGIESLRAPSHRAARCFLHRAPGVVQRRLWRLVAGHRVADGELQLLGDRGIQRHTGRAWPCATIAPNFTYHGSSRKNAASRYVLRRTGSCPVTSGCGPRWRATRRTEGTRRRRAGARDPSANITQTQPPVPVVSGRPPPAGWGRHPTSRTPRGQLLPEAGQLPVATQEHRRVARDGGVTELLVVVVAEHGPRRALPLVRVSRRKARTRTIFSRFGGSPNTGCPASSTSCPPCPQNIPRWSKTAASHRPAL